jgi:hypothetical protein
MNFSEGGTMIMSARPGLGSCTLWVSLGPWRRASPLARRPGNRFP